MRDDAIRMRICFKNFKHEKLKSTVYATDRTYGLLLKYIKNKC